MSAYGNKLNPSLIREPRAIKGIRQSVVITNNSSTIDQNQQLLVRFPNLSDNDVSARLAFTIDLTSTDANATVFPNLGRAIIKKTTIRISGNEVMSNDSDIYHCYVLVDIFHRANKYGIPRHRQYELTFNDYDKVIKS